MASLETLPDGSMFAVDYRVIRHLAAGGMGAVYVVEQLSTGKRRALKVMHPSLVPDEKSRARFVEEARVGSRIESEHVVEVLSAGIDLTTGIPYLVMELLEGDDLGAYVRLHGALASAQVLDLMEQIGHGLGAAHAQGIIHRDLKPENLFLANSQRKGSAQVLKILDFGIARVMGADRHVATVTTAIGSPLWMAPEQAQAGAKLRPATDVWALGLIAFELLTARSYWLAANYAELNLSALLVEIMTAPLEAASTRAAALRAPALPPGFDAWFARCVHRDPDQRFADAKVAVDALVPVLTGPGIPISPSAGLPLHAAPGSARAVAATQLMGGPPPATAPARPPESTAGTLALAGGAALVALFAVGGLWALNRPDDVSEEPSDQGGEMWPEVDPDAVELREEDEAPEPHTAPPDVASPPPNAERTASGLASRVLVVGTGLVHPGPTDRVTVHYAGWTTDGEQFDSSYTRGQPATFPLNGVIPGWTEGLQLMVAGEQRRLWIPGHLAYDVPDRPPRAGTPRGMLVFDVALLSIDAVPPSTSAPADVAGPPPSAERTASGLASRVLRAGTGRAHPGSTDRVTVHYTGWTTDGQMFDSSRARGRPATFPLDGVIPGWTEGVQLMVVGEERRLWIPADLAYAGRSGPQGMLVFDIELISTEPG